MERIIQEDILDRCHELINPLQHGFLSNRSCTTNLLNLIDDIACNLYNDTGTDIIYFDFAKAFDTVNHDLLLNKLKNKFNIDGRMLKFLTNYLKNRTQRVGMENELSEPQNVLSGVPQGSILGPLLFALFMILAMEFRTEQVCVYLQMIPKFGGRCKVRQTVLSYKMILTSLIDGVSSTK